MIQWCSTDLCLLLLKELIKCLDPTERTQLNIACTVAAFVSHKEAQNNNNNADLERARGTAVSSR
jgi:hypothetical protein